MRELPRFVTDALTPTLTEYDRRVLDAVETKARSTWWIATKANKGRTYAWGDDERYSEEQVRMTLRGLAHLGYVEAVAFGRWRRPRQNP